MKFIKNRLLTYYIKKFLELNNEDIENKLVLMEEYQAKIIKYSSFFDKKYYKEKYNLDDDIYLALHYLKEGYKKGYNPSLKFDTLGYFSLYSDIEKANINPLLHYELYGKKERRKTGIKAIYEGDYYALRKRRFILRYLGRILNILKIKKNKKSKILVVLHMFYMKSTEEIIEYLKNLSCYNYDLIVTYMDNYYDMKYLNKFKELKKDTKFIKCKNKGYDVGPFIDAINKVNLDKYDIVLKLQSKSTTKNVFIYNQFFSGRDWFLNLYQGILGPFNVHKMIDKLMNKKKCGLVASKNLIIKDPNHKQELVKEGLNLKKLKNVIFHDNYDFVAGSCFAIKSKCLKEIQKLKITLDDFEDTNRGFFSLGHNMERVICFPILDLDYKFNGNVAYSIKKLKWFRLEKKLKKYSALNLTKREDIAFSSDFVWHTLEMMFISNSEIINLPLKDLKREWFDGSIYDLTECSPYLYLCGNKKKYQEYIEFHKNNNLPVMSVKRYENLIKSVKEKGYDNKHLIVIDQRNVILDGQHRACILCYLNDKNKEFKILKVTVMYLDLSKAKPFSSKIYLMER